MRLPLIHDAVILSTPAPCFRRQISENHCLFLAMTNAKLSVLILLRTLVGGSSSTNLKRREMRYLRTAFRKDDVYSM
jgi:hypothetical protein